MRPLAIPAILAALALEVNAEVSMSALSWTPSNSRAIISGSIATVPIPVAAALLDGLNCCGGVLEREESAPSRNGPPLPRIDHGHGIHDIHRLHVPGMVFNA